jgi:hypothetical protein
MDTTVGPVALITGFVVLILILVAPRMAEPGSIPLRPSSFFSILLMLIFVPIGLVGLVYINQVASDPLNDLLKNGSKSLLILLALIFGVFLLVTLVCMAVRPTDGFLDAGLMTTSSGSSSGADPLIARLAASEARTCALMTRTDKFIAGSVGSKGMKTNADGDTEETPEHQAYVREAQVAARANIPGGILDCENPGAVTDTQKRVSILGNTLRDLVGPVLLTNFDSTINSKIACQKTPIPCYNVKKLTPDDIHNLARFDQKSMLWADADGPTLDTSETALTCYESNILAPMDALTARLQKGQLSECERSKAISSMTP